MRLEHGLSESHPIQKFHATSSQLYELSKGRDRGLQMCNIITFRFVCQHTLRRRRSRCSGTKHRITANSIKAACVSESFLTIYLRIQCGPCQHTTWEAEWKLKLARANTFLTKLRQRNLPGVEEITALVKELDAEYTTASWDTRTMFAHAPKASITRVKHSQYERKASKLPQEVRPEDVVDKATKKWTEMAVDDYDDDYIASTDPIHPVSTDYSHPLDNDDGAWILQHLSSEDAAGIQSDLGLGFNNADHGWNWADDSSSPETEVQKYEWQEQETVQDNEKARAQPFDATTTGVIACGPAIYASSSTTTFHLTNPTTKAEDEHKARVDQVIETFQSVINNKAAAQSHPALQSPNHNDNNTLTAVLNKLTLSDSQTSSSQSIIRPPLSGQMAHPTLPLQHLLPDHPSNAAQTPYEPGTTNNALFSCSAEIKMM
jgi:hypothetical protein